MDETKQKKISPVAKRCGSPSGVRDRILPVRRKRLCWKKKKESIWDPAAN